MVMVGVPVAAAICGAALSTPFALFFLWAVFGLFFALDIKNTLHDLRAHLLEYLVVFYLLVNYFSTQKKLEILFLIFITSATIFSIGAVISYYIIDGNSFSTRMGLDTFREMPTDFIGYVTIFAAIIAVRHFHQYKTAICKILFGVCFLVNVAATLLTQTRSSFIGLIAALVILCFANKKNFILIVVSVLLLVLMPGMKDRIQQDGLTKDNIRSNIYRLSLKVIYDYPIAGIGFGMQTYGNKDLIPLEKYNRQLPTKYQQQVIRANSPHNTFLDIAIRTGIVGLVLFLYSLLTAVWMLWKIFKSDKDEYFKSCAIYLFAGFVSFILPAFFVDTTYGPQVVVFYTILAMITLLWNLSVNNQRALKSH